MIRSFRSRALARYWLRGDQRAVHPEWRNKVRLLLSRLDAARLPTEMGLLGFGFHALKGNRKRRFAITVSRNWRITLSWRGDDAVEVDLEDYDGR